MLNKIVEACQFLLKNYPEADKCRDYLNSRISIESQDKFQFGYFPDLNNIQVLIDLVGEEALSKTELFNLKNIEDSFCSRLVSYSYFDNYPIIMPFRNAYGHVVALVGRTLLNEEDRRLKKIAKYKNTKETKDFKKSNLLFGLYENKKSILEQNCVYIVEGQFDVIKANEHGFNNIIALGTNKMTPYQFSAINRYTNNLILLLDNDEAGEKGRELIISKFGKFANIQNFYLPENYKDIDECLSDSKDGFVSFIVKN